MIDPEIVLREVRRIPRPHPSDTPFGLQTAQILYDAAVAYLTLAARVGVYDNSPDEEDPT